jgi:hypothetical protein
MHSTQHPAPATAPPAGNLPADFELSKLLDLLAEDNLPRFMRRQAI